MNLLTSRVAIAFLSFAAVGMPARAGDEVSCHGMDQVPERWPSSTACSGHNLHDFHFEVSVLDDDSCPGHTFWIFPGLPVHTDCESAIPTTLVDLNAAVQTLALDPEWVLGLQSIIRAAEHWNDVAGCDFAFNLVPTLRLSASHVCCQFFPSMICSCAGEPGLSTCPGLHLHDDYVASTGSCSGAVTTITALDNTMFEAFVLAMTPVETITATGEIIDADIVLSGGPWMETNDHYGKTFCNGPALDPLNPKSETFYDIEGALTHELGHVLGLGHDLSDSSHGNGLFDIGVPSHFPTMFPYAQSTGFEFPAVFQGKACTENVDIYGEQIGYAARTLEWTDKAAAAATYPDAGFGTSYGSIAGTVTRDGSALVAPGVHIVASASNDYDGARFTCLSLSGGAYRLDGLPAGSYYMYAEPVNWISDPSPGCPLCPSWPADAYFSFGSLPSWFSALQQDCLGNPFVVPKSFTIDYWNGAGEMLNEAGRACAVQLVSVTAGSTTACDFRLDTNMDSTTSMTARLSVSADGLSGTLSTRGLIASLDPGDANFVGAAGKLHFQVEDQARKGAGVAIFSSWGRVPFPITDALGAQLITCFNPSKALYLTGASTPAGISFIGTLGPMSGLLDVTDPYMANGAYRNHVRYKNAFVQAAIFDVVGGVPMNIVLTNPVNVWFTH